MGKHLLTEALPPRKPRCHPLLQVRQRRRLAPALRQHRSETGDHAVAASRVRARAAQFIARVRSAARRATASGQPIGAGWSAAATGLVAISAAKATNAESSRAVGFIWALPQAIRPLQDLKPARGQHNHPIVVLCDLRNTAWALAVCGGDSYRLRKKRRSRRSSSLPSLCPWRAAPPKSVPRNCRDPLLSTDRADTAATIAAQPQGSVRFLPFCQLGNRTPPPTPAKTGS
jgi:hypothetical protein